MSELSDETRRALAEYRAAPAVSKQDHARMWARLQASVAQANASEPDARSVRVSRTLARIAVAVAAAAAVLLFIRAVGSPTIGADTQPEARRDQAQYGATPDDRPARAQPSTPTATGSSHAPPTNEPADLASPATATTDDRAAEPPNARSDTSGSPTKRSAVEPQARAADPLREEIALLTRARRALERGDTDDALQTLEVHARRFPRGQMAEDRAALRPQVLCSAGNSGQALATAVAFARAYPKSAHADKVSRVRARASQEKCHAP